MRTALAAVVALAAVWPAPARADDDAYCGPVGALIMTTPKTRANEAEDAMDPAIVRRYLRRNIPRLAYCYEKELATNPGLAGALVEVQFELRDDGTVGTLDVDGFDATVDACITSALATIAYPRPKAVNAVRVSIDYGVAGQVFDVAAPSCTKVPAKARKLAEQVARAIAADDAAAFLRLVPARLAVDGKKVKKAAVKAGIASDGLATWLGIAGGDWRLDPRKKDFVLYRADLLGVDVTADGHDADVGGIVLRRSGKKWVIRGLTRVVLPRP